MSKHAPPAQRNRSTAPADAHTTPAQAADHTPLQPPRPDGAPTEDAIRARAFALWQESGSPEGDGREFWLRAEQELRNPRGPGG